MYAAEVEGLRALRAAGARAPEPFDHGLRGATAFIEMERLALGARADWPAMGRMLAALHRNTSDREMENAGRFGWKSDNWIGLSTQQNGWCDDWAEFWRERRLRPQLELARRNGFSLEIPSLDFLLEEHSPQPSLLHGDLWSGNAGFAAAGPVIFDPAVYYGDREADLAMTELFGGFPGEFYASYNEAFPLPSGYDVRKNLYNLYHLLNHLNIFGGSYLERVKSALTDCAGLRNG
jgi:protein-ribulosamine 3-kinase